jgi:hypothetical protein
MKLLKTIKDFFFKRKQKKANFSALFLTPLKEQIHFKKIENKNIPEELSPQEWSKILDKIWYAFAALDRGSILKSPRKRKLRETNINEGMELFKKYYKHLK